MGEKSKLVAFAEDELARMGKDESGMQDSINKLILQIVQAFADFGHSGSTAAYATGILDRLLRFLPLSPLTGADDEWSDIIDSRDQSRQNKRCSSVFRRADGTAYTINGRVFSDDGGKTWFTNVKSFVDIEFPYLVPTFPTEYLVNENGDITGEYRTT
jgi:hypothetical protein